MCENAESFGLMNEYLEVEVNERLQDLARDCYQLFGWTIINKHKYNFEKGKFRFKMQRKRNIENKKELDSLQKQCEEAFKSIEKLEKWKYTKPMGIALAVGLTGTVFMTVSTFSYLASMIPLCIILAIPGFLGWGLTYFVYLKQLKKCLDKAKLVIDSNYDLINETCEKAEALLDSGLRD